MQQLELSTKSWHYALFKQWGTYYGEIDLCTYTRRLVINFLYCIGITILGVLAGMLLLEAPIQVLGWMAGYPFFEAFYFYEWSMVISGMLYFLALLFGTIGGVIFGICTVFTNQEKNIKRGLTRMIDRVAEYDTSKLVAANYRSFKDKYCYLLKFKESE